MLRGWIEPDTRVIELTKGQFMLVDADMFPSMSQWNWHALWSKTSKSFYGSRALPRKKGERQRVEMAHRYVLGIPHGDKRRGDHIQTGSTLDNRRRNLRIASPTQSCCNVRRYSNNTSGLKGVSWHKGHNGNKTVDTHVRRFRPEVKRLTLVFQKEG